MPPGRGPIASPRWAGIELPVRARRRSVFVIACRTALARCPLVIDPSGVWFRPEGPHFICGVAPPADDDPDRDPDTDPLEPDHALFDDIVWPALAARVPAFETLKLQRAWAGFYEVTHSTRTASSGAIRRSTI